MYPIPISEDNDNTDGQELDCSDTEVFNNTVMLLSFYYKILQLLFSTSSEFANQYGQPLRKNIWKMQSLHWNYTVFRKL